MEIDMVEQAGYIAIVGGFLAGFLAGIAFEGIRRDLRNKSHDQL